MVQRGLFGNARSAWVELGTDARCAGHCEPLSAFLRFASRQQRKNSARGSAWMAAMVRSAAVPDRAGDMTKHCLLFTSLLAISPMSAANATAARLPFADGVGVSARSVQGLLLQAATMRGAQANSSEPADGSHQGSVFWTQDNWTVVGDQEDCSLDLSFVDEGQEGGFSSMSVTLHFGDASARVAFAHSKFTQIQEGKRYPLSLVFRQGNKPDSRWGTQTFTGFEDPQANALFADLLWEELHQDLITSTSVGIFLEGELLHNYPLEGARPAISQLEQCLNSAGVTPGLQPRIVPLAR